MRALALLVAGGLVLAGCGGSGDEDAVRDALTSYVEAVDRGDGKAACARMTESLQLVLLNASPKASDCPEALAQADRGADDRGELSIDGIEVDGDTARASVAVGGGAGTRHLLRRQDGEWRVDVSPTEG
jgi:hypothetical protein